MSAPEEMDRLNKAEWFLNDSNGTIGNRVHFLLAQGYTDEEIRNAFNGILSHVVEALKELKEKDKPEEVEE